MELLKRFVNIFATFLYLSKVVGAGDLQKKKFEGCGLVSLHLLQFNTVNILCTELKGLQNFTEFSPEGVRVKEISLRKSDISVFVDSLLYKMGLLQLEIFHFVLGNIKKIEEGAFKGGDTIQELDLTGNSIESLDPAMFRFLPNLERLHLDSNKLKQFAENAVIPNEKLRDLTSNENKIEKLNPKLFSKLNDLGVLILNDNQLKTLDVKVFTENLPSIWHVSLYNNPWECNCEFIEMMEFLEKKNMHWEKKTAISCSSKGSLKNVDILMSKKWANLSESCPPEIINQISQIEEARRTAGIKY